MTQPAPLPVPGQLVAGKYRIERMLGKGGMGAVFAAYHEVLRHRVALKVMLAGLGSASPRSVARFVNEARAAARIEGEHVARVLDVGQLDDGSPFIALEFLEGADLSGVLAQRGPLPPTEVVGYVLEALEALAQAHAMGIVHRDLKPANLFLSQRRDGSVVVKVLDFGISKTTDAIVAPQGLTATSSLLGSPQYMAPEQLRNAKMVDPRADIWAVGVILYELLAGRLPFQGEVVTELFVSILELPAPPLRALRPDLPPELEAVVMRCLVKDPAGRFANVQELATALAPFAPAAAAPSIERVLRTGAISQPGVGSASASGALPAIPSSGPPVFAPTQVATQPSWADSRPGPPPSRGPVVAVVGAIAAIAVVAVVGVVIGVGVLRSRAAAVAGGATVAPPSAAAVAAVPPLTSSRDVTPPPPATESANAAASAPSVVGSTEASAVSAATARPPHPAAATPGTAAAPRPSPSKPPPSRDLFDTPK